VYRKGTKMDGSAPMLLSAYGSYGASIDPGFSTSRQALLDRGFIYALASIRGGGELGEGWRDAGRMGNKMNTFTDFTDVADYLEKNKYTSADRLAVQGGSAGGLLMLLWCSGAFSSPSAPGISVSYCGPTLSA